MGSRPTTTRTRATTSTRKVPSHTKSQARPRHRRLEVVPPQRLTPAPKQSNPEATTRDIEGGLNRHAETCRRFHRGRRLADIDHGIPGDRYRNADLDTCP